MAKFKKILKWSAIVIMVLIAVLLIVNGMLSWNASSQLEQRLAAIREAADPVVLADLSHRAIAPEENAAAILRRAEKDIAAIEKEFQAGLYETETHKQGNYSEANYQSIKSAFDAYPDVVPLIEQAAALRDYDSQIDYTLAPNAFLESNLNSVQSLRMVARVLKERVELLLWQGKREEAIQTCIVLFRLSRHFDREPMMVSYLVSLACRSVAGHATNRVLLDGPISAEARAALDEELAHHDNMRGFIWCLKTERVFANEQFRAKTNNGVGSLFTWPFKNQHIAYLDRMDREIQLGAASAYEAKSELDALNEASSGQGVLVASIVPALNATREAMNRTRAYLRCLRVLNALQAHVEKTGAENVLIDDSSLSKEALTDPFRGEPLLLRTSETGWTIYSVGVNLKDDGGWLDHLHDTGAGVDLKPKEDEPAGQKP